MNAKSFALALTVATLSACGGDGSGSNETADVINLDNVAKLLETNADIAFAAYSDAVDTAVALQGAIADFEADPTAANLQAAKLAWLVAREPYGQTEVYRFRLSPIDSTNYADEDGPEGDINAWPLGEALIDYVVTDSNQDNDDFETDQVGVTENGIGLNDGGAVDGTEAPVINIIASDVVIDADLISSTATAEDEHDVIAGYHAIEFMLWGQDLNNNNQVTLGNDRDMAVKTEAAANRIIGGTRPLEDFTTNPGAARRFQFLKVVAQKLVDDLTTVRDAWEDGVDGNFRDQFTTVADRDEALQKLAEVLTGMGTLSEGELAGERMQIAFSANSQEDEHSCFSDNTHRDIWLNAEGVSNSYYGVYAGYDADLDGIDDETSRAVNGYGFDDYAAESGIEELQEVADELETKLAATQTGYQGVDSQARAGMPVDVLIMDANRNQSNPLYSTILALNGQSAKIQELATALDITADVVDDEASECDTSDPGSDC